MSCWGVKRPTTSAHGTTVRENQLVLLGQSQPKTSDKNTPGRNAARVLRGDAVVTSLPRFCNRVATSSVFRSTPLCR